jgi:stalled ribosome rescue protein Dom34
MNQMAVWIDHHEARIFHIDAEKADERIVDSVTHHVHRHEKSAEVKTRNHPDDEVRFFREVAHLLEGAAQVLVLGPSVTKLHFVKFAHEHNRALSDHIVGVETADHPTDKQIVAHVRSYFHVVTPRIGV